MCVCVEHTWKTRFNDASNKKNLAAWISFDYGLGFTVLRRFLPLCGVFGLSAPATRCQDADFFQVYGVKLYLTAGWR